MLCYIKPCLGPILLHCSFMFLTMLFHLPRHCLGSSSLKPEMVTFLVMTEWMTALPSLTMKIHLELGKMLDM